MVVITGFSRITPAGVTAAIMNGIMPVVIMIG
jgi:hypothetical protein